MEKLKGKYEVILGFVTLVISLSAFKEELAQVHIQLGYATISLADYFLYTVYGFSICLYLYITEHVARETKIGTWKVFNYTIIIAFFLFAFILSTPILLIINIVVAQIYTTVSQKSAEEGKAMLQYLATALSLTSIFFSLAVSIKVFKERSNKIKLDANKQEILELENAIRLFADGYYSHSVLESFKVFETHLYKVLTEKGLRVNRARFTENLALSLKYGIILQDDMTSINKIKNMRNVIAHTNAEHTKQEAFFALEFVKQLINRNRHVGSE